MDLCAHTFTTKHSIRSPMREAQLLDFPARKPGQQFGLGRGSGNAGAQQRMRALTLGSYTVYDCNSSLRCSGFVDAYLLLRFGAVEGIGSRDYLSPSLDLGSMLYNSRAVTESPFRLLHGSCVASCQGVAAKVSASPTVAVAWA